MNLDVADYTADLEESQEKLNELGSILDQTSDTLQKASEELRLIQTSQETANQSFKENATGLLESLSEFGTNAETRLGDLSRVKEELDSHAESSNSKLSSTIELASSLVTSTQEELANQEETFTTALNELSDIISQFIDDVNLSVESTNSEITLFTEGESQLSTKANEVNDYISTLSSRIASLFEDLSNNLLASIQSSTESIYVNAFSTLDEEQSASIEEALTGVSSELADLLETFSESCTTVGEELMVDVGNLLLECTADITENIQQKLSDAFEDAVENMLKEILTQLGSTVTTMTLGSTISTTMSPLIPALKTIGTALEGLNKAIDFFD
jgi:hypothetical protein